jgi:hypothetical protein
MDDALSRSTPSAPPLHDPSIGATVGFDNRINRELAVSTDESQLSSVSENLTIGERQVEMDLPRAHDINRPLTPKGTCPKFPGLCNNRDRPDRSFGV